MALVRSDRAAVPCISVAVLLASATWFAGAAAAPELAARWQLGASAVASLTTATQFGFVVGTLLYALLNLADRFPPRAVFAISATLGSLLNLGFADAPDLSTALGLRFGTGLFLAGVYPVGMKLVAAWSPRGLGLRLGLLVGALTLGTAFPYAVRGFGLVSMDGGGGTDTARIASVAALLGAGLIGLVATGPHLPKSAVFQPAMIWRPFRNLAFRRNAFGYFGHMIELYAFWSLLPTWLLAARATGEGEEATWQQAFYVVGIGGVLGCVGGGLWSQRVGELRVARTALLVSGACCLTAPLWFDGPDMLAMGLLMLWGVAVIADSPQFSALAARTCPPEYVGTALTVQNGLGFLLSVGSIQAAAWLGDRYGHSTAMLALGIGPVLALLALRRGLDTVTPAP